MEEKLTIEQMQQRSADARKVAKELERRLRNITEPEARKALARLINISYAQAKNGEKRPNAVELWQNASSANSTVLKQIWMMIREKYISCFVWNFHQNPLSLHQTLIYEQQTILEPRDV